MRKRVFIIIVLAAFAVCAVAVAQQIKAIDGARIGTVQVRRTAPRQVSSTATLTIPHHMNYQGYLTDNAGNPINRIVNMDFSIWTDPSGGERVWGVIRPISVEDGLFNVVLGTLQSIPDSVFESGGSRWLQLVVEGQTMLPRTEITSVAYAYKAENVGPLETYDSDWFPFSVGNLYTKIHNLGTTMVLARVWFSDQPDGSSNVFEPSSYDFQFSGIQMRDLTATQISIAARNAGIRKMNADGSFTDYPSGYARIIMIAFE